MKHDLGWIEEATDRGWCTLLDAADFVPTNRLDLRTVQPVFVTLSFYKIFGYPTGPGCLSVCKDRFETLRKPWFAGGLAFIKRMGIDRITERGASLTR